MASMNISAQGMSCILLLSVTNRTDICFFSSKFLFFLFSKVAKLFEATLLAKILTFEKYFYTYFFTQNVSFISLGNMLTEINSA